MKAIIIVSLLATGAWADNCYVHERGTDSWHACKEQAAQMERGWQEHRENARALRAETSAHITATMQTEETSRRLRAILNAQKKGD